jgi:hypothetical protein
MDDHEHGPSHREAPAGENGATSTTTSPDTQSTCRWRVYAQEMHADLGLVDDGSAVGS